MIRAMIAASLGLAVATSAAAISLGGPSEIYFSRSGEVMTDLDRILSQDIAMWRQVSGPNAGCIYVFGYTDTIGEAADNLRISTEWANQIRDELIRRGVEPEAISAAGSGEWQLSVATADEVNEPLNRKVEIYYQDSYARPCGHAEGAPDPSAPTIEAQ